MQDNRYESKQYNWNNLKLEHSQEIEVKVNTSYIQLALWCKLHLAPWSWLDWILISVLNSKTVKANNQFTVQCLTVIRGQCGTAGSVSSGIWHLIHPGSAVCFVVIPNMGQRAVGTMTTNTRTSLPASAPLTLRSYVNVKKKKKSKLAVWGLFLFFS